MWSQWGVYLGCCFQSDGAKKFRDKTSLGRPHTLGSNLHNQSMIVQLYSNTLITFMRCSADSNLSTRQLLYIHYHTLGLHDKNLV
jgi:hypothetical protein